MSLPHSSTRRTTLKAMLLTPLCAIASQPPATARASAHEVAEAHFDGLLKLDPVWATDLGMGSADDASRIAIDIAPAHRERARALHEEVLSRLGRIPEEGLDADSRTVVHLVRWIAEDNLARLRYPDHLLPLDQQGFSIPFRLASAVETQLSPFATVTDFERHIERLRMLPTWCTQAVQNMKRGLGEGVVHSRPVLSRLSPMLRQLAKAGRANPYMRPLEVHGAALKGPGAAAMAHRYARVVADEVIPALSGLADFVSRQVLPAARPTDGWWALPDGAAWYEQLVRTHTSTDWSHDRIHSLGLKEVEELTARILALQGHFRFRGSLPDFLSWHGQRPQAHPFTSQDQVLDGYRRLQARVEAGLGDLFVRLPKAALEVRPEPELTRATAGEHYDAPSPDGSRPGVFYAPVPEPSAYMARTMTALFLHEGIPGHHLQVALAQELPLTRLQKHYFHTAYGEGWALYAETLGHSLRMYDDPDAELGYLIMAMVRAVRLVVDTGLHAKRWTYGQAVSYFARHTGYSKRNTQLQIERYMAQPGQALGYAVGRMRLERMRDQMQAREGSKFSLPAFHDAVLRSGALPLAVLEESVLG